MEFPHDSVFIRQQVVIVSNGHGRRVQEQRLRLLLAAIQLGRETEDGRSLQLNRHLEEEILLFMLLWILHDLQTQE